LLVNDASVAGLSNCQVNVQLKADAIEGNTASLKSWAMA